MKSVSLLINVGDDNDCDIAMENREWDMAVVHACKTCHQKALGYSKALDKEDPNYLVYEGVDDLYLNIIDAPFPLSPAYGDPIFKAGFQFIDKKEQERQPILIHCNKGHSRGASIALAYLASRGEISYDSYKAAKEEFTEKYPDFEPGKGVEHYLENNWSRIMDF